MYPPKYFPGTYFPRRYFPAGGLAIVPITGVALKYFTPDFYAPSYFAGSYFPNGATSLVSGYPEDLFEAIARFFASSTAIQAAGFTGIWADAKPRGEANPALIVKVPDGSRYTSDSTTHWFRLAPSVTIQAETRAESARLGELAFAALKNATFVYGPVGEFKTGPLWLKNQRRAKDQVETVNGQNVFRHVLDFECFEFRPRG